MIDLVSLIPLVPLPAILGALVAYLARTNARVVARAACLGVAVSLLATGTLLVTGAADRLGTAVGFAVSLIAFVVHCYAARAMQGNPAFGRFFALLSLATAASLEVCLAQDIRLLSVGWVIAGLATSGLLAITGTPAARRWAFEHLAIERIGDLALLVVLGLCAFRGSFSLADLDRATPALIAPALACALVIVAAVRSVQIPFARWLPNSMETPTPVSAFMHAGIVNGGGFLLARCSHLVSTVDAALALAVAVGAITALGGALFASVRPEAKRGLGWSTVAQMGFMIVQCGCGAFGGAVLHMILHGAYKSTRFLGVAGAIERGRRARELGDAPMAATARVLVGLCAIVPTAIAIGLWTRLAPQVAAEASTWSLVGIAFALGAVASRRVIVSTEGTARRAALVIGIAGALLAYLLVLSGFDLWLGDAVAVHGLELASWSTCAAGGLSGALAAFGARWPFGRAMRDRAYVFALHEGGAVGSGRA